MKKGIEKLRRLFENYLRQIIFLMTKEELKYMHRKVLMEQIRSNESEERYCIKEKSFNRGYNKMNNYVKKKIKHNIYDTTYKCNKCQ